MTLEAMAHRHAVIATRAAASRRVRPDVNGWLFEPSDVDAMTRAVGDAVAARPA